MCKAIRVFTLLVNAPLLKTWRCNQRPIRWRVFSTVRECGLIGRQLYLHHKLQPWSAGITCVDLHPKMEGSPLVECTRLHLQKTDTKGKQERKTHLPHTVKYFILIGWQTFQGFFQHGYEVVPLIALQYIYTMVCQNTPFWLAGRCVFKCNAQVVPVSLKHTCTCYTHRNIQEHRNLSSMLPQDF